jgi:PLAT/LH2 domain
MINIKKSILCFPTIRSGTDISIKEKLLLKLKQFLRLLLIVCFSNVNLNYMLKSNFPIYCLVTSYEITLYTGDKSGAGTDSQVYITLFGNNGKRTEKLHLKKSLNNKDPFERNQIDQFRVEGNYIGELIKLRIEHDNTGRAAGWFLDRV